MNDKYEEARNAAREQMMREANADKQKLVREIKQGFGEQMIEELKTIKPPSKWKIFWGRFNKVLGV